MGVRSYGRDYPQRAGQDVPRTAFVFGHYVLEAMSWETMSISPHSGEEHDATGQDALTALNCEVTAQAKVNRSC